MTDDVVGYLQGWRTSVDKRTTLGKMLAERIDEAIAVVEHERDEWGRHTMELEAKVEEAEQTKAEHQQIILRSGLVDEQKGYNHQFEQPQVYEGSLDYGTWVKKDFTVAYIEEAMYRLRCAGATDATPVFLREYVIECDTRYPLPLSKAEQRAEARTEWWAKTLKRAAVVAGIVLVPAVGIAAVAGVLNLYWFVLALI